MHKKTQNVSIFYISQATTATFVDLYFCQTCLIFIRNGSKTILDRDGLQVTGKKGDVFVCPAGSLVTIKNQSKLDKQYQAIGIAFGRQYIHKVFHDVNLSQSATNIRLIHGWEHQVDIILGLICDTFDKKDILPNEILQNRLIEPLLWLKKQECYIAVKASNLVSRVRELIETEITRSWNSQSVAQYLGMSEASMRRKLHDSGIGFGKILLHTRLEKGLFLLQTTQMRVISIALDCGFQSSSHFSATFKKRFKVTPKEIRKIKK